eukprot:TRINITY_DN70217_c0_g1_i1.p1 TRINITY_DN70217_c0_g1~~TRINITY_DN70217_c0_g1_i1.p1  ORF type:complete len:573 (+),score=285.95 TRINITY_DN70217_c0_g1_i1:163-1719(+)
MAAAVLAGLVVVLVLAVVVLSAMLATLDDDDDDAGDRHGSDSGNGGNNDDVSVRWPGRWTYQQQTAGVLHEPVNWTDATPTFVQLSDVHYDEFYDDTKSCASLCRNRMTTGLYQHGCGAAEVKPAPFVAPMGRARCDTPPVLMQSVLDAASSLVSRPRFVVISGDLIAHWLPQVQGTGKSPETLMFDGMQAVLEHVKAAFPAVPIYAVLGNNDAIVDYTPLTGELAQRVGTLLESYIRVPRTGLGVPHDFSKLNTGAYYWTQCGHTLPHLRLIGLNTIVFSSSATGQSAATLAADQLQWLRTTLAAFRASGDPLLRAMIVGHIPPVVNGYGSGSQQWQAAYADTYMSIVYDYRDMISSQHFGHFHSDEMRVPTLHDTPLPVLTINPSVTPNFLSNPSFRRYLLNTTVPNAVVDYEQWLMDLHRANVNASVPSLPRSRWQESYRFRDAYLVDDMTPLSALAAERYIRSSLKATADYLARYHTHWVDMKRRLDFVDCAFDNVVDQASFAACRQANQRYIP